MMPMKVLECHWLDLMIITRMMFELNSEEEFLDHNHMLIEEMEESEEEHWRRKESGQNLRFHI